MAFGLRERVSFQRSWKGRFSAAQEAHTKYARGAEASIVAFFIPPGPMARRAPLSPRPLFGRRKRVPTSRAPSAVQAGSVANGSPARLRACRACSWRPRWPRLYGFGFVSYQVARFCSDPPSGAAPRQRRKAPHSFAGADSPGPWRLIRVRSRLTAVCSELCTCELRVKSAVRLVPFARFSSDGLRAPPPSVPTSTSLGVPTQPRKELGASRRFTSIFYVGTL
jgi:hypothetical protein